MQRPVGVTILAILGIVGGILSILGALALFGFGALGVAGGVAAQQGIPAAGGALLGLLGIPILISGVLSLAFGIGALGLKPWAWLLGVISYGLSVLTGLFSLTSEQGRTAGSILGLLVSAGILYYLTRPEIRGAFRRA